jgi:hypothetical protein
MFYGCESLKQVSLITSNINDAYAMFYRCTQFDASGDGNVVWDFSAVENAEYMFMDSGLTNLPCDSFPKVKWAGAMFRNTKLKKLSFTKDLFPSLNPDGEYASPDYVV